jgi:tetratricopeptide (TPR) repeat protein
LHLHPRQLAAWERAELITPCETYGFEHLTRLRTLRDLRATRVSAKNIRASVEAMRRVAGMGNPLLEATAVRRGSRLDFRHGGALIDPVTQQLAFDFELASERNTERRLQIAPASAIGAAQQLAAVQDMFLNAVKLEEDVMTLPRAVEMYISILALKPDHAPSLINLGTIHYNRREFEQAEKMYRKATVSDPDYALAFFDLGNVLDEMQRLPEATVAYQRAVTLVPQYADAHYNLALAYERQGQRRRALRHWLTYVRLDPVGPWSAHAQAQARKILSSEKLSIVSRRGRRTPIAV